MKSLLGSICTVVYTWNLFFIPFVLSSTNEMFIWFPFVLSSTHEIFIWFQLYCRLQKRSLLDSYVYCRLRKKSLRDFHLYCCLHKKSLLDFHLYCRLHMKSLFDFHLYCRLTMLSTWTRLKFCHLEKGIGRHFIPKQAPVFTCLHYKSLKTLWKKEKLLVISNFSLLHSVFHLFGKLSCIFIKYEFVVCKLFQFGKV